MCLRNEAISSTIGGVDLSLEALSLLRRSFITRISALSLVSRSLWALCIHIYRHKQQGEPVGRAIAQAVSRRFPTATARVQSRV
jgi:hypothetical protein